MTELTLPESTLAEDSSPNAEQWVMLASRENDGLLASLHTLGGQALATTTSKVFVYHNSGVTLNKEGPLAEVAPMYHHPMAYVSKEDALKAYPPPYQIAAERAS